MRCDELKPDYMLYAIGGMEEPELSEIRAHLESGCAVCTSGLREAQALAFSMGALMDGPELPPELRSRVLAIAAPAEDDTVPARPKSASTGWFWSRPLAAWQGLALAFACLTLAVAPAVLWRRAVSESNAREAAAAANLAQARQSATAMRDQVAKLEAGASLRADPIVPLEFERGAGGEADQPVTIPAGAAAVVLALPTDLVRSASAADLADSSGKVIRTVSPLPAGDSEATGLTIDARLLTPGRYSLALRSAERTVARFRFQVKAR